MNVEIEGMLASTIRDGVILFEGSIYPLNLDPFLSGSGDLVVDSGKQFAEQIDLSRQFQRFERSHLSNPDAALDHFAPWLIARDLQLRRHSDVTRFRLPPNEVRIYVNAELPHLLACRNAAESETSFGKYNGRIVYRIDLTLPEGDTE